MGKKHNKASNHDDILVGGNGNDKLSGRKGDDTILGGGGKDKLSGGKGDDVLEGGSGNDKLSGGKGDDVLDGGAGSDKVKGGKGDDTAIFTVAENTDAHDVYDGGKGNDTLRINLTQEEFDDLRAELIEIQDFIASGSDSGHGHGHHRHNHKRGHADAFETSFGLEFRHFENVVFYVDGIGEVDPSETQVPNSDPVAQSDAGTTDEDTVIEIDVLANDSDPDGDVLTLSSAEVTSGLGTVSVVGGVLAYDPGDNYQYLNAGDSVIVEVSYTVDDGNGGTTTGTASITVEGADEVIVGTEDRDILEGTAGNDIISALGGSLDIIYGTTGSDTIDGGDGNDVVTYQNLGQAVTIDLGAGTATSGGDVDQLTDVEIVVGTSFADTLIGGDTSNDAMELFLGGEGADVIVGVSGWDEIGYTSDISGIVFDAASGTVVDGWGDIDTFSGIDRVRGSDFDDVFNGDGTNNYFIGQDGNDTFNGGGGNDEVDYHLDDIYGATQGINLNFGLGTVTDGFGDTDTLSSIEKARGSDFDDVMVGGGNDYYEQFQGMGGNDWIDGGSGWDEIAFHNEETQGGVGGVTVNFVTGTAVDSFGATDTFFGIDSAQGTLTDDVFIGDYANTGAYYGFQNYTGLAGNDTFIGGTGNDRVNYSSDKYWGGTAGVTVDLAAGYAIDGFGDQDTLSGIERVRGSDFNDIIIGDGANNRIEGGNGDDTVSGGGGWDTLDGQSGTDTAVFSGSISEYTFSTDSNGRINVLDNDYSRDGNGVLINIEYLQFSDGTISINDAPILPSLFTNGNDVVDFNTVVAGTYSDGTQYHGQDGNDVVTLANDQATADIAGFDSLTIFDGGNGDDTIIGGQLRDYIYGAGDNDTLYGGSGNDYLQGGSGNDFIDGGSHSLTEGSGDAVVFWDSSEGATVDLSIQDGVTSQFISASDGYDVLVNIEEAHGSNYGDHFTGDNNDNAFFGLGGDDTLIGGGGNDHFTAGSGSDYVDGGAGSDLVSFEYLATSGANVDLAAGVASADGYGGSDTLISIENVNGTEFGDHISGDSVDNYLDGRGGNDIIVGGAGNDWLEGGAGNDTLTGGADHDNLSGGTGDDLFVFSDGNGDNTIHDFVVGAGSEDVLDLTGFGLSGVGDLAMTQTGGDVRIQIDADDAVTLIGTNLSDIHSDDLLF